MLPPAAYEAVCCSRRTVVVARIAASQTAYFKYLFCQGEAACTGGGTVSDDGPGATNRQSWCGIEPTRQSWCGLILSLLAFASLSLLAFASLSTALGSNQTVVVW